MKPFFVYLLHCADGSYYAGHTDDLSLRLQQHGDGKVGYTATRKPVQMLWHGDFVSREEALSFELRIKGWSRAKKEALIAGDWTAIQRHAWGNKNPLPDHLKASIPQPELRGGEPERAGTEPARAGLVQELDASEFDRKRLNLPTVRPEVSKGHQNQLTAQLFEPGPTQRRAIAKAITLLESTRTDHRSEADAMLTALLPQTGKSFRLGLSGVPGVGKSTFIEALGLYLISQGHRVAVLAVDPSSTVSGGSILGDKTRMEMLSVHPQAFIRPSPSRGNLGGVAAHTRESILVLEAAGFDVVIVETVGVGQSEVAVQSMTDMFALMQLPNAGDDLQAIKKGVMELADVVLINKADLDGAASTRAQAQITSAMRLFGMHAQSGAGSWQPRVMQLSALKGQGVADFWGLVQNYREQAAQTGAIAKRREAQTMQWLWDSVYQQLRSDFESNVQVASQLPAVMQQVRAGSLPASAAARILIDLSHLS